MPYSTAWVDPEVFLEHKGVKVYHIYKRDDVCQCPRDYWYSLSRFGSDEDGHSENGTFDVRDLPFEGETNEEIICRAIADGFFDDWTWEGKDE